MAVAAGPNSEEIGLRFGFDASNPRCTSSPYTNLGSGSSGSLTNAPVLTVPYYQFNGTQYVDFNVQSFDMYAFEIWIEQNKAVISNPETSFGPYYSCVGIARTGFANAGLNIGQWTGAMAGETVSWWSGYPPRYGAYIQDDIPVGFHHYFINWNGSTSLYEIWIDGTLRTTYQSTDGPAQLLTGCNRITIGYNPGFNYYFLGNIGMVKAYDVSFTSSQIEKNFDLYRDRFGV